MADSKNILTPEFRVSFPHVFAPQEPMNPGNKPKYSIAMLFAKGEDLSKLKAAAEKAAKDKWGDEIPSPLKTPFRDQGEREYDGYEAGAIVVSATNTTKPGVVNDQVEKIIDESEFYAGCYAQATVVASAYGGKGTKIAPGVNFYLQNIQKIRDGESLAGRMKPEDEFAAVAGAGNTEATEGGDGEDSLF